MLTVFHPKKNWIETFFEAPTRFEEAWFTPHADIVEENERFLVKADLPGGSEKDIQIELEDGQLFLRGEGNDKTQVVRCERAHGKFERIFRVGDKVDADKIEASFENGELTIVLPKQEKMKSRKIAIN